MKAFLAKIATLRQEKKYKLAEDLLSEEIERTPGNGELYYQMAWTLDNQGKEEEAVFYYERAIDWGLNDESLAGAYLGLGSTYKNTYRLMESLSIFKKAIQKFPEDSALRVFFSISLMDNNQSVAAYKEIVHLLLETPDLSQIQNYRSAIEYYVSQMK
jgi:tetratricopeptide (TPR) repeat protein